MGQQAAGYVLQGRALNDAVSDVWYARRQAQASRRALVRTLDARLDLTPGIEPYLADARMAAELMHRNVLRATDVGDVDQPYVVSPFVVVTPLSRWLGTPMPVERVLRTLGPLGSALDAAAAAGVPHGAVHPATILMDERTSGAAVPRAMLTGFGLHHLLAIVAATGHDSKPIDDLLYVAPELLRGGAPTDRGDQYSLAAAVYHAVAGRPPFGGERLAALYGAHLFSRPPALDTPELAGLTEILARGLAKNPADRFSSCSELIAEIERWHAGAASFQGAVTAAAADPGAEAVSRDEGASAPAALAEPAREPAEAPAPARDPSDPATASRWPRVALALAVLVVAVGAYAAARLVTIDDEPPITASAPGPTQAPTAASLPDGVQWRRDLGARPAALHVAAHGLVAETDRGAVVVDRETGAVTAQLMSTGGGGVVAEDRYVTSVANTLRAVDVTDGSVRWQAPAGPVGAAAAVADTVYGVSDAAVPQLIATDAESGERLWAFPEGEEAFPATTTVAPANDFVYLADGSAVYGILPKGATVGEDTPLITATERASEPLCLWRHEVDGRMWRSSLHAVEGGVAVASRAGTVCLRDHIDGESIWCTSISDVARHRPTIYEAGQHLLVATRRSLIALDPDTGDRLWRRPGRWHRATLDSDRLVTVTRDGTLETLALDTGVVEQPSTVTVGRGAALAVDGDVVYAAGRDGTLLAIDLPET